MSIHELETTPTESPPAAPGPEVAEPGAPGPGNADAPGTGGGPAAPPADAASAPPLPPGVPRVRRVLTALAWSFVGLAVVVGLWQLAASSVPELPTPAETFTEMRILLADPFYDNGPNDKGIGVLIGESMARVFKGFTLAALVGVPAGLAIGASRRAWQAFNPVVQLLRPVSPLAWYPIWLVVLKDVPRAGVWVIFITALWPIVLNTAAGVATVPQDHKDVARVFRFGRVAYLRQVLVPDALPSIVTGLRVSMGIAWMVIVAVEMLSGGVGIGAYVWNEYNALNLAHVICAIVLIGLVGLALDLLFLRLAKAAAHQEAQP
jgi:nitrate/nitrite transport system permease protein